MIASLWYLLGVLFVLDLAFTAVRASLANTRLPLLLNLREQRAGPVDRATAFLDKPRSRISMRLAMLLIHFSLAGTTWQIVQTSFPGQLSLGGQVVILLLAGLVVLLLESVVEGQALRNPEEWLIHLTPVGEVISFLLTPISVLAAALMGYTGTAQPALSQVTEDELKNWVQAGQPEGSLEKGEREMIYSIFRFRDTLAREVMVPRIDIQALEINTPLSEAIDMMEKSGHSRVPVYEENIDNIVGLLYSKDLLRVRQESKTLKARPDLLRPAYFVPEAKKADEMLTEMQSRRIHMAIVVDEYGGVAGMVTLEDIVEEIIGEIQDEYDQAEEMLFQQVSPDEYVFQGRIDLDDVNDVMGSHLAKDGTDTLGGLIYGQMGRIPAEGESVEVDSLLLTVEQVTGRRIRKVRAKRIQPKPEVEVDENNADR